jgi:hypothetical protein
MAGLKPRATGVVLLPKPKFPQGLNRWPVKTPKPAAFDPRVDQALGKYR